MSERRCKFCNSILTDADEFNAAAYSGWQHASLHSCVARLTAALTIAKERIAELEAYITACWNRHVE